jgi:hypothetical protein
MNFVQSATGGTMRTDGGLWAGFQGLVGWQDLLVSSLARWIYSGNNAVHSINLLDGLGNLLSEVSLNAQVEPVGFVFINLNTPVRLPAGSTFFVVSQEPGGATEGWTDDDLVFTTTADAAVTYSVSTTDTNGVGVPTHSKSKAMFVPVNFQYTIVASTPTPQVMVPT